MSQNKQTRQQRRAAARDRASRRKINRNMQKGQPDRLGLVPPDKWPQDNAEGRQQVWRSKLYLVQVFAEDNDMVRLSVCRAAVGSDGRWEDKISWDELQSIKRDIGMAERFAVEIYPPDKDIVNVANMRHLWVYPTGERLEVGWSAGSFYDKVIGGGK